MIAMPVKKRISEDFQALIPCISEEIRTNTDIKLNNIADDIIHKVPFMCCEIGFLMTLVLLSADKLSVAVFLYFPLLSRQIYRNLSDLSILSFQPFCRCPSHRLNLPEETDLSFDWPVSLMLQRMPPESKRALSQERKILCSTING